MRSRTLWVAALIAVLGVIQESSDVLKGVLNEHTFGVVMIVIGALIAGLRVLTTQPLVRKPPFVKRK